MRFRVLGPLEVRSARDAQRVTPRAAKIRSVLATLLVRSNEVVSVDSLVDELWGRRPPRTALTTLQVYISQLRKLLREVAPEFGREALVTRAPGYLLQVGPAQLDLVLFEELHRGGRQAMERGEHAAAADLQRRALELWRGPLLSDTRHGSLLSTTAVRMDEVRIAALEQRVRAELVLGRHKELVGELQALAAELPLHEEFHAHLMVALYRAGRQADALHTYSRLRHTLVEELAIEPGVRLRRLQRRVLAGDRALLHPGAPGRPLPELPRLPSPAPPPPPATPALLLAAPAGGLPDADPLFTGRERELARLAAWLRRPAGGCVQITGPAGAGKTALAVAAAHRVRAAFPDGCVRVRLCDGDGRPLDATQSLLQILRTCGAPGDPAPRSSDELHTALRQLTSSHRRILLLLDDITDATQLRPLLPLLPPAEGCAILLTCRAPLPGLGGHTLPLDALTPQDARQLLTSLSGHTYAARAPYDTALTTVSTMDGHADLPVEGGAPADGREELADAWDDMAAGRGESVDGRDRPADGTGGRANGWAEPPTGQGAPIGGRHEPIDSWGQPAGDPPGAVGGRSEPADGPDGTADSRGRLDDGPGDAVNGWGPLAGGPPTTADDWSEPADGPGDTADGPGRRDDGPGDTADDWREPVDGPASTADDWGRLADGPASTVGGWGPLASGPPTTADGRSEPADGPASTADDWGRLADGPASTVGGWGPLASGPPTTAGDWSEPADGAGDTADGLGRRDDGPGGTADSWGRLDDGPASTAAGSSGPDDGPAGAADGWGLLAEWCGWFPGPLRAVAGHLAAHPHHSPARLAARLRRERTRLAELRALDEECYRQLCRVYDSAPEADRRAARLLSLLPGGPLDPRAAATALGIPPQDAGRVLNSLVGAGLLGRQPDDRHPHGHDHGYGGGYRFPVLVRLLAAERRAAEEPAVSVHAALARLCAAACRELTARQCARAGDGLSPLDWFVRRQGALVTLVAQAHAAGLWGQTARLAEAMTAFVEVSAAWQAWEHTHTLALDAAGHLGDRATTVRLLRSLGDLAWQRHRPDAARDFYQRALDITGTGTGGAGERGRILAGLADLHLEAGATDLAARLVLPTLTQAPEDTRGCYEARRVLALHALETGGGAAARPHFRQCLTLAGVLGDHRLEAYARRWLDRLRDDDRAPRPGWTEIRPGVWYTRTPPHGQQPPAA
ncbi:BTAD domain-containing putative transcriptional regulator [Streptomyces sp. NPDC029674]|uniref:BTAD domain-containing putative transcriptional regulator n=1 Tax=Streptomyces sp. NPDC029674 TaxID=3365297 RepID=UPI00384A5EAF